MNILHIHGPCFNALLKWNKTEENMLFSCLILCFYLLLLCSRDVAAWLARQRMCFLPVCLSVCNILCFSRSKNLPTLTHSLTWAVSTEQQMFQASSKHWNYCNDVRKILFYFNMWPYISNSSYFRDDAPRFDDGLTDDSISFR